MNTILAEVDYTELLLQSGIFVGGVLAALLTLWKGEIVSFFSYNKKTRRTEQDVDDKGHFNGFDLDKTHFTDQQSNIYSRLSKLQIISYAARISIAMFHNGGELVLDGIPIKRYSVTHEVCEPGISHERNQRQGLLMTLHWEIVSYIRSNSPKIIAVTDMPHSNFKSSLENSGISHISILPITKEETKKSVGFLFVEWAGSKMLCPPADPMKIEQFEESFVRNRDMLISELSQYRNTNGEEDKQIS